MKHKVCVVTGSRAEYGLLRRIMEGIRDSDILTLQVIATGMHLSEKFGLTRRDIEADGFRVDREVETLIDADTPSAVTKSLGLGVVGFADAFKELEPDLVVVLGDRYEIFAAAVSALIARVPIAHLHGGELSEGAFDDAIRHSITKMSSLHFVAAEPYRRRVIQLGESPDRVHLVGAPGVDSIHKLKLLDRSGLEEALGFELKENSLLVTFHPVTLEADTAEAQMQELLAVLDELSETSIIFTMPNADTDGRVLFELIESFVDSHPNARAYTSLGQLRYLSCMRHVDAVVGNSSSGLVEMPAFKKGTINIGDRQKGRLRAASVIDCVPERQSITDALEKLYSREFQENLKSMSHPFGEGNASEQVIKVLESTDPRGLNKKSFFDVAFSWRMDESGP